MRDFVLTAIIFILLPVCVLRPWVGILTWSWIGYMNPHRLTWGFAMTMPWAQMVAIATLAGCLLTGAFLRSRWDMWRAREVWLILALWATFIVTTITAIYPEEALDQLIKVSKILFMTLMTLVLIQNAHRVKLLLWVIGLSIGFYGLKGGIFTVNTGGVHQVLGPPETFFGGNTEVGLALNMVLPILVFLRRQDKRPWVRHVLFAVIVFSVIAVIGTYSRGAFLGLIVVLAALLLKSRRKTIVLGLLAIGIALASTAMPEKWFGRMGTIQSYEEDRSATNRLEAWKVATHLANERPLTGGGFRTFTRAIFERYGFPGGRDAHSIYFQVLGEHGFVGLALYLALIGSTWLSLRGLIRRRYTDPARQWIPGCAQMLEASLLAYLITGAFLSLSYFDLFYHLVIITVILKALSRQKATEPAVAGRPAAAPAGVAAA